MKFIRPSADTFFNCYNIKERKFMARLKLGLRHLHYHDSKHNFQDLLNPICNSVSSIKTTVQYFLHFANLSDEKLSSWTSFGTSMIIFSVQVILEFQRCLYLVSFVLDEMKNKSILNTTNKHIALTKRFDVTPINSWSMYLDLWIQT